MTLPKRLITTRICIICLFLVTGKPQPLYTQNINVPQPSAGIPTTGPGLQKMETQQILKAKLKQAVSLITQKEYDSGLAYLDQGLAILRNTSFHSQKLLANFCFQKANCCFLLGNYNSAVRFYQQSLSHLPDADNLKIPVYMNLGDIFYVRHDYDNAIDYYLKALILNKSMKGRNDKRSADLLSNIGACWFEKNDPDKALYYLLRSKTLYERTGRFDTLGFGRLYVNLGSVYLKRHEITPALTWYRAAAYDIPARPGIFSREQLVLSENFATAYAESGNFDSCRFYLSRAQDLISEEKPCDTNEAANIYRLMGNCASSQHHWQEAMDYYSRSLSVLLPGYQDGEKDVHTRLKNPVRMLEFCRILADRADAFYHYGLLHPEENVLLRQSFSDYLLSLELLDRISKSFGREGSKLVFNESTRQFYTIMMNIGSRVLDVNKEAGLDTLFGLSERSRSNVLLGSVNEKTAKTISGIPGHLLKKDSLILNELTSLSTRYLSGTPLITREEKETMLTEQVRISNLFQEHDSLTCRFEKSNPRYFELKYGDSHASLAEIRKRLDPGEALIEYFTGDSLLFIFLVSKEKNSYAKSEDR